MNIFSERKNQMELREMKYILAIAQYGNLTKASEKLYLTQPTLTKFLQMQEKQMGLSLFKKVGKHYVLTYAGERFVEHATEILRMNQELDNEINSICEKQIGRLNIGLPIMRVAHILPLALPHFRNLYPNVEVNVSINSSSNLETQLINGEIDIAFFLKPNHSTELSFEPLYEEEFLLAVPPNHQIADIAAEIPGHLFKWIDLMSLKNEPFVLQLPGQRSRQIADLIFEQMGFKPKIHMELENIVACLGLVSAGYGCSFVTESLRVISLGIQQPPDFFSIGSPKYSTTFVAAYRKNLKPSKYAQSFIDTIRLTVLGKPRSATEK